MRVAGYVDGFNLYYGLLKGRRGVKWLDVVRIVELFADSRKLSGKRIRLDLAARLILDAVDDPFDIAVIVSNDSDLVVPIKEVRQRFGKQIWVLSPHRKVSRQLRQNGDRYLHLRASHVKKCQLPDPVRTPGRQPVYKPRGW